MTDITKPRREGRWLKAVEPADMEVCGSGGTFLQSGFWGAFKAAFGWRPEAFVADWGAWGKKPLLIIRRPLVRGVSFAYAPWGPELPEGFPSEDAERSEALAELACALRPFLPRDTCFIRFDPPWFTEETPGGGPARPPALAPPLVRAGADVQPPDTVIIDLRPSPEGILAGMKPKWRYNTRLALKRGVQVREAGAEGLPAFYGLLKTTRQRDGIAIHSLDYYQGLFALDAGAGAKAPGAPRRVFCYLASHEGEDLAAAVVLHWGAAGVYLYGASSDSKRGLMAPYALQYQAMLGAKEAGCLDYDLFGIPPTPDPSHPMAGLYRFKTGFGGRIIHRPGSWDFPYRPLLYRLFRSAETLRKNLRTLKKKAGGRKASHKEAE